MLPNCSFASFIQGSRKCSFKVLTPTLKNVVSIHFLPIAHAATPSFYDSVLQDLDATRALAQQSSDANSDLFTFEAANLYHRHHQAEQNKRERNLLSTKRFVTVVEGASENEAEREMETEELALIQRHVKMTMAADDLTSQGMPADLLQESASFVQRFQHAVDSGQLYSEAHLESICAMYSLPYPLPGGLVLQDSFFRPRLAFRHGDCIVNGDIIATQLADPSIATRDVVAFHHQRELSCVQTIKQLVHECDDEAMTTLQCHPQYEKNMDNTTLVSQRHIVVVWGHYHCQRLLNLVFRGDEFDFAAKSEANSTNVKDPAVICEWSDQVKSYGWTQEMVQQYYGIMESE